MSPFTRRKFLYKSAAGLAGASLIPALSGCSGKTSEKTSSPTIGVQSWVVRELIGKDFPGTLKMLSEMGYNSIEMCSPPSYKDFGFGALQSLPAAELKKILNDAGMSCVSCHYPFSELKESLSARMDFASELGLTQMVVSTFWLPETATLADWKKAADELNAMGEQSAKQGLQMAFHNHNEEFSMLEGELIYDALLSQFDPNLVKMQFQVWVVSLGFKAADYFRRHPGRFISAHLYDWSGTGEEMVPLGKGVVDWNDFFDAAKTGGVKNTFVEMDVPMLQESSEFLKKIENPYVRSTKF
jgi:sugar phosphate isomerase/epimerase